ncbi:pre-mRNA-splicing factor clf1 [Piromyces finnis]|uniref:Pre-mRNA-splicing factor clf1 n=1 Tax=Piromyces finnis TaxID=1754191 RepID=A0A1Y1V587_9FUNG|nr:pre-mRNA-splicing factor clf1 [Piromyces finnis]|eukprot:ORX46855.1 pre-mRNA-splicing factor clf1 [Piromyces finnis]
MDRQSRPSKVKNKNPAPIQITAEQILLEAKERQEQVPKVPKQKITDKEELDDYRLKKRKTFEDVIRRNKGAINKWLQYASWEESQNEMERARSVYERALDIEHRNTSLWTKYAEMEIRHKNINHARNIYDRAVAILPRIDQFWYKYTYMEEMLGNVAGARQVFERWMDWEPTEDAWLAYIKFEKRYHENDRVRSIYERFISLNQHSKNWIKYSKFEEQNHEIERARAIYEQCLATLDEEDIDQHLYISFAKFETRLKEYDRARVIYKYALDHLPKDKTKNLYKEYTQFEKQFGQKDGIEDVILQKRRIKYEEEVENNPNNYDSWIDYIKLEETTNDKEKIREVYERAVGQTPPVNEKRLWQRYIYLWIFYAIWEEQETKDIERAEQIYEKCLSIIPHKTFTFAKIWLLYAKFLIRRFEVGKMRKLLGRAIGLCPKEKLFKGYIEIELKLREFDNARKLYQKYLEWNPGNCYAWIKYGELEIMLGDNELAEGIFEIAVNQPVLDMPEVLWKAYIDFEVNEREWDKARELYKRLLSRTDHVKVWISYANFEASIDDEDIDSVGNARKVFQQGYDNLKKSNLKEERVVLLESWKEFETEKGDEEHLKKVEQMMPKIVKKRRRIEDETGGDQVTWEEYLDYIFPDEEKEKPVFKLLSMAHAWKQKMEEAKSNEDGKKKDDEKEKGPKNDDNDDDDDDDDDDE